MQTNECYLEEQTTPKIYFSVLYVCEIVKLFILNYVVLLPFPMLQKKQPDHISAERLWKKWKNKPWWICWHGCLLSHSIGIIPPAADSSKMKPSIPGFTGTLNKILLQDKKEWKLLQESQTMWLQPGFITVENSHSYSFLHLLADV